MCGAVARGQDVWTLTTLDFQSRNIAIVGIDEKALRVSAVGGGGEEAVAIEQFLSAEREDSAKPMTAKFALELVDGDRLAGEPAAVVGEQLRWNSPALGSVEIPLRRLAGMSRAGAKRGADTGMPAAEDAVLLSNGDSVTGIITDIGGEKIVVSSGPGPVDVPIDSVAAVRFASAGEKAVAKQAMRLSLDDGSLVTVSNLKLADGKMSLQTLDGQSRQVDLARVTGIEQVHGPLSWLSSRQPGESVQTSFLESNYPAKMNRSVTGGPIRFKDRAFAHGIGVHAQSKLVFPLDGSYQAFRTQYAIDGDLPWADVTVRIKADDKVLHEAEHVRAGVLSPVIQVDLGDAKLLTLEVDYGANNDVQDRFNWIEPALIRK